MEKQTKKRKKKKGNVASIVIIIICLVVLIFALSQLIPILLDYKTSKDSYDKLNEDYVEVLVDEGDEGLSDDWWFTDVQIDFEKMRNINSDVIAWLRFDNPENIDISYPILYSGDDEKYLRHDLYGNSLIAGSIFLSGASAPDFSDYHDILYGHNMRNGSMFGSLKKYKIEEGFYEENQFFTVYTAEKAYRYQIFSYHDVSANSDLYRVGFGPDDTYQAFINKMLSSSYKNTGIRPEKTDRTLTLSTCSSGENVRFVIHAVRVDEREYTIAETAGE